MIDRAIGNPACNIPIGFAGAFGVLSEPNGLYYMNARYYDPTIGRFLSEDPLGLGGGDLTLYSYAGNNPLVFVDPSGLCAESGGTNLLRSPRFGADGNLQLNPRGLLGSFGVPISGGIVGTGVAATAGTAAAIEYVPAVTSFAVRHRHAIAAGAKKIGNTLSPNPWLSLESPTKGAVAAWGLMTGVNYLGNLNLGSGNSGASLINPSVAPVDNTRVRW